MSNSSNDKSDLAKSNMKNATIWAVVIGLVTVGLVFWILESQGLVIRLIAGVAAGVAVAMSSYRKSLAENSGKSKKSE